MTLPSPQRPKGLLSLCALFLLVFSVSCKKSSSGIEVTDSATTPRALTYQLVWSDEFNGTSVDQNNWTFETGGGGWGNNELENYQTSNAQVTGGNLVITAKKQTVGSSQYTSARLKTQGKKQFTYGRIEARIKMPQVQGLWPAFWMLGANIGSVGWPQCGETDIMEHVNTDNNVYGTIHWYNNGHASYGGSTSTTPSSYHVYDVVWDTNGITWHVDGVQYWVANIQNNINGTGAFHNPFFIILNLAVGGNWPGNTIDNSHLPSSMYVDYVRVYQLK